jgi:hypothetical protein
MEHDGTTYVQNGTKWAPGRLIHWLTLHVIQAGFSGEFPMRNLACMELALRKEPDEVSGVSRHFHIFHIFHISHLNRSRRSMLHFDQKPWSCALAHSMSYQKKAQNIKNQYWS